MTIHYQMSAEDWPSSFGFVDDLAVAVHYQMFAKDWPFSFRFIEKHDPLQSVFLPISVFCAPAQRHWYFAMWKEGDLLVIPVQSVPSAASAQVVLVIVVFLATPE